jgi:hypothetical protein
MKSLCGLNINKHLPSTFDIIGNDMWKRAMNRLKGDAPNFRIKGGQEK